MKHETKRRIIYTFACFVMLIVNFFLFRNFIKVFSEDPKTYMSAFAPLDIDKDGEKAKEDKTKSKDTKKDEHAAAYAAAIMMMAAQKQSR